ncbi:PulJ/GspJ family protein [Deinococcus sp. UYEF24]
METDMRRQQGFTLTELLVTMAVFSILGTIGFGIYNSSAKLFSTDQGRINTNQNLRTSLDLMTQDLREAGEGLTSTYKISGVEFIPATDTLTIRKGLSLPVLSVCQTFSGNPTTIKVIGQPSDAPATPAQCAYSDAGGPLGPTTPNNVSDKIDPWVAYKGQSGNAFIPAILYNPSNKAATRVQISSITNGTGSTVLNLSAYTNSQTFSWNTGSVIIPVDERRYYRSGDELRLIVNEDPSGYQSLGFGLTDVTFTIYTTVYSGSSPVTTSFPSFALTSPWQDVSRIDLGLVGGNVITGNSSTPRTLNVSIFPRNVTQAN